VTTWGWHVAANRWFGTGRSTAADPAQAGREACLAALAGRPAGLLVVFASLSHATAAMAEAVHAAAGGDVLMIGCSTSGEFTGSGRSQGVVVSALGGDGFAVHARAVPDGVLGLREAGMAAAECLDDVDREHRVLLLLGDGRSSDQQEMVRGAYAVAGSGVPLVGGCAGDGMTQSATRHFFSSGPTVTVLTNAVLGAAIGSDSPFGVGMAHGWHKSGDPMVVTRSKGGEIYELDGEPALEVYLRHSGGSPELTVDPDTFLTFATVRPLGLSRRTGEDLRIIFAADAEQGSISGLADTPQGAVVWHMAADDDAVTGAAAMAGRAAVQALDGTEPLGVLVFDCCVRLLALGEDGTDAANHRLRDVLGDVPYGGFYSNGEIVRTSGAKGMHHLTVAALALS
jgi:hypothetical protein